MKTQNKEFMNHTITIVDDSSENLSDELREEYDVDSMEFKPNPFVAHKKLVVELTDDVAEFFQSSQQVNDFLRNQIKQFQKVLSL